jgi:hypothetical protein
MKRLLGSLAIFVAVALAACPAGQSVSAQTAASTDGAWRPLTGAELGKLLPGFDIGAIQKKNEQPYSMYLKPDGTFDGEYVTTSGSSIAHYSGTWRLNGNAFCVQYGDTSEYCRGIETQGDGGPYRYADDRLPITVDSVRIVNNPAPGVPAVMIVVPGTDIPKDVAALSGVWTGKWDSKYDMVLEVMKILPNGFAEIAYRYVKSAGDPFTVAKSNVATIQGSTLTLPGMTLTVRANDATKADGVSEGTSNIGAAVRTGNVGDRHGIFNKE